MDRGILGFNLEMVRNCRSAMEFRVGPAEGRHGRLARQEPREPSVKEVDRRRYQVLQRAGESTPEGDPMDQVI